MKASGEYQQVRPDKEINQNKMGSSKVLYWMGGLFRICDIANW